MSKLCSIDECSKTVVARGWCGMHYRRWSIHGDVGYIGRYRKPRVERFWDKVVKSEGCWIWSGYTMPNGYGSFSSPRSRLAHRYSYELHYGEVDDGLHVDHMCHVRNCVNPQHLRLATHKENMENRQGAQPKSKTGVRGVFYTAKGDRFYGLVAHNKKRYYCGSFDTLEEAERAVVAKRNELFTHNDVDRI